MLHEDLFWSAACTLLVILCAFLFGLVLAELVRCYHVRLARVRRQAEQKALVLLKQWLSPAQLAQYERDRTFDVTGSNTGKRYRIRHERQMNIDEFDDGGRRIAVWCFGPEGSLPLGDSMLTQKLALENDERAALAVANRSN
jgi:hypothetical protein